MKKCFWFMLFFLASLNLKADEFLCSATSASGHFYDKTEKTWKPAIFNIEKEKYVLRKSSNSGTIYQGELVGLELPIISCKSNFNDLGIMTCDAPGGKFVVNRITKRFMRYYIEAYYNVHSDSINTVLESENTPYIVIGDCIEK